MIGKPLELDPLELVDGRDLPARPWLVPGALMKGHLTLLTGRGGGGKSLMALHFAVACATGRRWLCWEPREPVRVLLLSVEDDTDEQQRRLVAVCRQMRVTPADLQGRLELIRGAGSALVVRTRGGAPVRSAFYHALAAERSRNFGLVVLDPLVSMSEGLDENSNTDMQQLAAALRDLSRLTPACPVLAVHHTRKGGSAADPDSARGASALLKAARIQLGLDPMTDKEAVEYLEPREFADRWRYARTTLGKSNYSRRGAEQWLQMHVHPLGNGDESPAWDSWDPGVEIDPSVIESPKAKGKPHR